MLFFVNPGEDDISQIVFIYFNSFLQSFQVGEQFYIWYWLKGSSVLFSHEAYDSKVHDTNNTWKVLSFVIFAYLIDIFSTSYEVEDSSQVYTRGIYLPYQHYV